MKIISLSGCYWSGSSAVIDLLSEHDECLVIPEEFSLFGYGQFFEEVYDKICKEEIEIDKLYKNLFIFNQFNLEDLNILMRLIRKLMSKLSLYSENLFATRVGMSNLMGINYNDACNKFNDYFIKYSIYDIYKKKYKLSSIINELLNAAAQDSAIKQHKDNYKVTIFDQLIAPPYFQHAINAIPSLKMICVDRSYRDQYIDLKKYINRMTNISKLLRIRPWGEIIENYNNDHIDWFVDLRKRISYEKENHKKYPNNILWIQFEELVNNTEETANKIFSFLEIDDLGWMKNTKFYPNKSFKNIDKVPSKIINNDLKIIKEKLGLE